MLAGAKSAHCLLHAKSRQFTAHLRVYALLTLCDGHGVSAFRLISDRLGIDTRHYMNPRRNIRVQSRVKCDQSKVSILNKAIQNRRYFCIVHYFLHLLPVYRYSA